MSGTLDYLKDELATLERDGLLLHPRTLEGPQGARARYDGRDVINLASNNYLGLANHPRLNEAASRAAMEFGAGSGAVRTIAGQMTMHRELEARFAAFKHADAALMFQSGFTSNAGTVAAILGKDDVIVSRPAEPRLDHRRRPALEGRDRGLRAPRRRPRRPAARRDRPARTPAVADHRRRVLDGRRHRAAARPRRGGGTPRRDHDGRRRPCERGARRRAAPARSTTSGCTGGSTSRSARCRRRSACWAASSPGRRT